MASLKLGIALLRMEKEKKVVWAYSANSDSELMFLKNKTFFFFFFSEKIIEQNKTNNTKRKEKKRRGVEVNI
jgi:hypothetical protein